MFGLEAVIIQGAFKLALALLGIIMGRITLWWFDYCFTDAEFMSWLKESDPLTRGIYHAGRFIAIAIIIGSAIG